ncbi:MAG: LytTR family transcriptional regulator DNA-binding domain-containing protein [Lachnospiraceae bacterium]|nr:LytTR family transcriptional regulator DNA-binding domain-containing protein [Lachnospiraceae bacterium]MEE1099984.1 LytTR family DNA-binding domain-containing protein [Agathobacter sp.]
MRYEINKINCDEPELILNYEELNPEVKAAIAFMEKSQKRLVGKAEGEVLVFSPDQVLYFEKVDEKTFAYTDNSVIQVDMSLYSIEIMLDDARYFRCSKSMIVNVSKVSKLKSLPSNRIDVTLTNGEHIIISRTYASDFRRLLKGEG